MLMAAAVRAPTSVAIALFTLAVSAASLVNSPVVRLVSGCLSEAQPLSATAVAARAALRNILIVAPLRDRLVVPRLHRIEGPPSLPSLFLLVRLLLRLLLLFHAYIRDSQSFTWRSASSRAMP